MFLSADRPELSGRKFDLKDYITAQEIERLTGDRTDSSQVAFFLRDLTDIYARTFDVKYPDLKARQILPVYTGVDAGAEGYVWRQFDRKGTAKIIDSYAGDLPSSEVVAAEFQSRILSLGASYNYSIQDLRKARMANIPLETRKAFACRRAMEQALEQIAFFGVAAVPGTGAAQGLEFAPATVNSADPLALYGLTNFPNLTVNTTTNDWTSDSTAVATIVDDFNKQMLSIVTASNGVHTPDTAVFPLSIWSHLNTKPRSLTFTDDTILQYLMKHSPWLKTVYWTPMLETAGLKQDNATAGPRIVFMERNEENIQLVIPQEFEQFPPQMVNLTFKVPTHMRVGGIRVSYPKAFIALDGAAG